MQPILDGRQRCAATACVAQVIKATSCLTINTRKFNGHSLGSVEKTNHPQFMSCLLLLLREPESSHTSTLRNASARANAGFSKCLCSRIPAELLPELTKILLAGLVAVLVASFLGTSYLPQRPGPAASTWRTDVDFLVHLHELASYTISICRNKDVITHFSQVSKNTDRQDL